MPNINKNIMYIPTPTNVPNVHPSMHETLLPTSNEVVWSHQGDHSSKSNTIPAQVCIYKKASPFEGSQKKEVSTFSINSSITSLIFPYSSFNNFNLIEISKVGCL